MKKYKNEDSTRIKKSPSNSSHMIKKANNMHYIFLIKAHYATICHWSLSAVSIEFLVTQQNFTRILGPACKFKLVLI